MIIVSDTTPIISILKIDRLDLLKSIFSEIMIPKAVFDELTVNSKFPNEAEKVKNCDFFKVVELSDRKEVDLFQRETGLDLGESEAIIFSKIENANTLLIDEVKGRFVAKSLGLKLMGTVGILITAFKTNLITKEQVLHYVEILKSEHRHIGQSVFNQLLSIL